MTDQSTYAILDALASGETRGIEAFSPYRLKALLLPGGSVANQIYENAAMFECALKDVALLSWAADPRDRRPGTRAEGSPLFRLRPMAEGTWAYLATFMPLGEGAYLILTDDLRSGKVLLMRAFSKHVVDQLLAVQEAAASDIPFGTREFLDSVSVPRCGALYLDFPDGWSLASVVADAAAVAIMDADRDAALPRVKAALAVLKAASAAGSDETDRYLEYRHMVQQVLRPKVYYCRDVDYDSVFGHGLPGGMGMGFIVRREKDGYDLYRLDPGLMNGAEMESKRQFRAYDDDLYFRYKFDRDGGSLSRPHITGCDWFYDDYCSAEDFSVAGACLGNILEEEVNASVVQLLRQSCFGMPMPDCYRLYVPMPRKCLLAAGNRRVDYNFFDVKRSRLRLVPVGEVNATVRSLLESDASWEGRLGVFADPSYLEDTGRFSIYRNYSSHPGIVGLDEFKDMRGRFISIMETYLPEMVRMKEGLKMRS